MKMKVIMYVVLALAAILALSTVQAVTMQHHGMTMDEKGMIMNENLDNLPKDCPKISEEVNVTIRAGHKHAQKFNGLMFAFDQQQWSVPGCAKINITFINDDEIRHQLMIHGLPGYLYSDGMFTMEIYGIGEKKASLIVPSDAKTYLVHCEVPQHMEKGMKAQLKVAGGDGDLPSIPGVSAPVKADSYPLDWNQQVWLTLVFSVVVGFVVLLLAKKLIK